MSYLSVKKTRLLRKGPVSAVSCAHLLFRFLTKTRICSVYVARNKAFISANLMHECIVIAENTRVQFLIRLSKYCT